MADIFFFADFVSFFTETYNIFSFVFHFRMAELTPLNQNKSTLVLSLNFYTDADIFFGFYHPITQMYTEY